jgi:hypothetical protein
LRIFAEFLKNLRIAIVRCDGMQILTVDTMARTDFKTADNLDTKHKLLGSEFVDPF